MAYNVIGNVVDEKNKPLIGVSVDDGSNGVITDINGYYAINAINKSLNFRMIGYETQTFDLSKYPDGSSVNVDITMVENKDVLSKLDIDAKKTNRKYVISISTALLATIATHYIAKRYTKSMPIIIGSSILVGIGGFFAGGKIADSIALSIDKKRQNG